MSFLDVIKKIFGFGKRVSSLKAGDRVLICEDCEGEFVFDAGEQRFFKTKGFSDPKRCPDCRRQVKFRLRKNRKKGNHNHHHQNNHNNNHRGHGNFRSNHMSPYVDER